MTTTAPAPAAPIADPTPTPPPARRRRRRPTAGRVLGWAVLAVLVLATLFPFYWMLRTALSTNAALPGGAADPLPGRPRAEGCRRAVALAGGAGRLAAGGS